MKDAPNLVSLLEDHVRHRGGDRFLYHYESGAFVSQTYQEVWSAIESAVTALKQLGVQRSDRVALMSHNRPEWLICDMAILSLGAVVVPLYPTLSPEEVEYILRDSGAKVLFCETAMQVPVIEAISTVVFDMQSLIDKEHVCTWRSFMSVDTPLLDLNALINEIDRDDLASIVYTSGTTGPSKGVMLTHGNFLANVEGISSALPLSSDDSVLSFLPLSHVFERTAGYYMIVAIGGCIYYARSMTSVGEDLGLVRPTVLVSVPRVYEKIYAKITQNLSGIKKYIFQWAHQTGLKAAYTKSPSLFLRGCRFVADRLVYSKVREKTGGRLRFFVSGGAPLGQKLGDFFLSMGLLIIEGYGQTESSPVIACNRLNDWKMGSVGKALDNVEVKIASNGELLARGPSIMRGYYGLTEKTKQTIDDEGWLHTGDVAEIDDEGFIFIVDRLKDLIVLSNGKNIAPQKIETLLVTSKYITQAVVVGESRNYVAAILVPDFEQIKQLAKQNQLSFSDIKDLLSQSAIHRFLKQEIDQVSQELSRYERVKTFCCLDHELTQESGVLTPTLKPKRPVIREKYRDQIESLYR